jgi:hypothetical protein
MVADPLEKMAPPLPPPPFPALPVPLPSAPSPASGLVTGTGAWREVCRGRVPVTAGRGITRAG